MCHPLAAGRTATCAAGRQARLPAAAALRACAREPARPPAAFVQARPPRPGFAHLERGCIGRHQRHRGLGVAQQLLEARRLRMREWRGARRRAAGGDQPGWRPAAPAGRHARAAGGACPRSAAARWQALSRRPPAPARQPDSPPEPSPRTHVQGGLQVREARLDHALVEGGRVAGARRGRGRGLGRRRRAARGRRGLWPRRLLQLAAGRCEGGGMCGGGEADGSAGGGGRQRRQAVARLDAPLATGYSRSPAAFQASVAARSARGRVLDTGALVARCADSRALPLAFAHRLDSSRGAGGRRREPWCGPGAAWLMAAAGGRGWSQGRGPIALRKGLRIRGNAEKCAGRRRMRALTANTSSRCVQS